ATPVDFVGAEQQLSMRDYQSQTLNKRDVQRDQQKLISVHSPTLERDPVQQMAESTTGYLTGVSSGLAGLIAEEQRQTDVEQALHVFRRGGTTSADPQPADGQ
ncbi:MAG: hypothetical protein ACKPKO_31830, partial [Candidatus Fonsibacter sp.]